MINKNTIENLYSIKKEWEEQIDCCKKGIGIAKEVEFLREDILKLLEKIIPSDSLLTRELDKLKKRSFTLWSGRNGYLLESNEVILKKWLDFIEKVIKEIEIYPVKVYFDASLIFTPSKIDNIKQKEVEVLRILSELRTQELSGIHQKKPKEK